ncbi:MAG: hypothetical protein VKN72_12655 [Nostocales cyanobacterium 94392]|nr:hypothetical protein [Nostocales cyanobacterium 94392]
MITRILITNYQLPITNYQLPITNYQLPGFLRNVEKVIQIECGISIIRVSRARELD